MKPTGSCAGVRVVGLLRGARLQDVGEALAVLLGEAIGRALGRRGLQVVHVSGLLLEGDDARAHVIQQAHGEARALPRW